MAKKAVSCLAVRSKAGGNPVIIPASCPQDALRVVRAMAALTGNGFNPDLWQWATVPRLSWHAFRARRRGGVV